MDGQREITFRKDGTKVLVLLTVCFPYGSGEWFLETELPYLVSKFRQVIIAPLFIFGTSRIVPKGVTIDTTLGWKWSHDAMTARRISYGISSCLISSLFYREICFRPRTLIQPKVLMRVVGAIHKAMRVYRWVLQYIRYSNLELKDTVFYTYWFGPQTLGVGLAKAKYPEIKLISRLHGGELYPEQYTGAYFPLLDISLQWIDRIFAISKNAMQFLTETVDSKIRSSVKERCEVARLGVKDPEFTVSPSKENVFRIVSCSSILPVKSLHLLIEGLHRLALTEPDLLMEWHHFGEGPLHKGLEKMATRILPDTVKWIFHGFVPNEDILRFYRTKQIDVFVNVSRSEGIPVSIMEAQSCGIPVIAPRVRGIPEIVNNDNGILLGNKASAEGLEKALKRIAFHKDEAFLKGIAGKQVWLTDYNADTNYNAFVDRIMELFFSPNAAWEDYGAVGMNGTRNGLIIRSSVHSLGD